jgi:hypothetical protein
VLIEVDDDVLDGLHAGFHAWFLGRFRYKEVGDLLND